MAPRLSSAIPTSTDSARLVSLSPNGRIQILKGPEGPIRTDRVTGATVVRPVYSNWLPVGTDGRVVDDESGHWVDIVTGTKTDVPIQMIATDAHGEHALVSPHGGFPYLLTTSTGAIRTLPVVAQGISPSGQFVEFVSGYMPATDVNVYDLATERSYSLGKEVGIVAMADDGTVVLESWNFPKTYTAVNVLTGRRTSIPGRMVPILQTETGSISSDGTVVVSQIGDQIAAVDLPSGRATLLGPWPIDTPLHVVSSVFVQGDGAAVSYSVSDFVGNGAWSTQVVTLPIPGRRSRHVVAGQTEVVDLTLSGSTNPNVMNVTVVDPARAGFVTVFPCSATMPVVSNINFNAGETRANLVLLGSTNSGTSVCLYSSADADLVVDIQGSAPLVADTVPQRVLDTRTGVGVLQIGRLTAGAVARIHAAAPTGTGHAAALNVTAASPTGDGYLTVFPCGTAPPTASNVNYVTGQTVANAVLAPLNTHDEVCVYTSTTTDVIVDVDGYLANSPAYQSAAPLRLLDTRMPSAPVATPVQPYQIVRVPVRGQPGIPPDVSTAILNVTATSTSAPGYVTAFACGGAAPLASNLNYGTGDTVPGLVISAVGSDGAVCFLASSSIHLVVDLNGTFRSASSNAALDYKGMTPLRVFDSRLFR